MKKLHISCPICSKFKIIPVPRDVFNIDEGSLLKLPITRGLICQHQFICVIDYNFSIRDYEIPKSDQEFTQWRSKSTLSDGRLEFNFF